jgi:uncharacterized protein YukE
VTAHRADLELMRAVVDHLAARSADLVVCADRLARQHAALVPWSGLAADAHDRARAPWDEGFATMRAALVEMRAVVDHARAQYDAAAADNVGLWEQLS